VHFSPQRREDHQENPKKLCALGDLAVQMSILYREISLSDKLPESQIRPINIKTGASKL
jgi:hypothetical protein